MAPVFLAYARQSLAKAADAGDSVSVADQFRLIDAYAARLGGQIVGRYSDVDVSGNVESRDGLDQLLRDVKVIKPDGVIIRDVSRLARDTRLFLTLMDTLGKVGIQLLSATESLEDRTLATVVAAFAERERLMLAGRVAGGVREHARRGKTHGRPAYGYRRHDGVLTIQEDEAAVVRRIFSQFAAGEPIAAIRDALNAEGIPAPTVAIWRRNTIETLLRREVYRGAVAIRSKRDIAGRLWPAVVTEGAHPAIVDDATWEAAQRAFRGFHQVTRGERTSVFAGFLVCAHCGGPIYAVTVRRHDRAAVHRAARCGTTVNHIRNGADSPACAGPMASRKLDLVELAAGHAVLALLDGVARDRAVVKESERIGASQRTDAGEQARKRLAEITRRRARLLDAYESGALEFTTWRTRDRALAEEEARQQMIVGSEPPSPDADWLLAVKRDLKRLPRAQLDYRAVLSGLGARIVVDLETLDARVIVDPAFAPLFPGHAEAT